MKLKDGRIVCDAKYEKPCDGQMVAVDTGPYSTRFVCSVCGRKKKVNLPLSQIRKMKEKKDE